MKAVFFILESRKDYLAHMNTLLYIDPNIGMMIAQGAVAAFAGFVLFYKTVIATIKGWLGMNKDDDSSFDDMYDEQELKDD
ncbi:MAG: hypothetical protein ACSHWW_13340 [Nonlabens sp.]|uniref:hypothetical protein n=1 Tax=Nonlabens sp. TaxID=1888209 RepID=UPI003EF9242B